MNKTLSNKKSIAVFVLPAFLIYVIFALFPIAFNYSGKFFSLLSCICI